MFNYEYRSTTDAGRVCLELSLKPFGYDKSLAGIEKVCRDYYKKWAALLEYASGCSVLLWTSDGSEIFEFTGDLDRPFEWCKYIGIGNWDRSIKGDQAKKARSLHQLPIYYMENPPEMTYRDLKNIIDTLKRVGKEMTGMEIQVGETFDPGPEFAYSAFKYERHPEIAKGDIMGKNQWLHCAARLHAEKRAYAAYPDGIPENTHIGEFLGRQFMALKKAVSFDYLWLSNGFGFSLASWNWVGELFDGEKFDFSGAKRIREAIAEFWDYFNAEIGDTVIETRGSNLSTGMDIAAHGCPIDVIYKQNIVAPPNSPWAAMDYRFGLELSGFMSHIAVLPKNGYAFRYYSHDPWWLNSPWFDRYDRSPHDIYLPLAVTRLDENLNVTHPYALDFLTADDSFGRIPARGANEMTPHMLTAFNDFPDEPGLVTWVYPFDAYCRLGLADGHMERMFMDDWYIESAIDHGFPVNTVLSDGNFIPADKTGLLNTLLLMPVPEADSALEHALFEALDAGARVLLYGSTRYASERLRAALGLALAAEPLEGVLHIETSLPLDTAEVGTRAQTLMHDALVSNGGAYEVTAGEGTSEVVCTASAGGNTRVYAVFSDKCGKNGNGKVFWVRGSFPHKRKIEGHLPPLYKQTENFPSALLLRAGMALFGYPMRFECYDVNDKLPLFLFSKCRGALWFNLFSKDATVRLHMSTPDGAPVPDNMEFIIENSVGTYPLSRWNHTDCRIFVKQAAKSKITLKKGSPETHFDNDERLDMHGLIDAEVTFYPTHGGSAFMRCVDEDKDDWAVRTHAGQNIETEYDKERGCYIARHVTGRLTICWQEKENFGDYKRLEFLRPQD